MIVHRLRDRVALGTLASVGVVVVGLAVPALAHGDHRAPTSSAPVEQVQADAPGAGTGTGTSTASATDPSGSGVSPELEPLIGSLLP